MTVKLSGKEKALVFLSTLGDEISAKVLECIPEKMSTEITEKLSHFPEPSAEAVALVYKELNKFALAQVKTQSLTGTVEQDADIEHLDSLSQLDRKPAQDLLDLMQDEKPQTIAFILSFLSDRTRDNFYNLLSVGRKKEISSIKVEKVPLSSEVFEKINEGLLAVA